MTQELVQRAEEAKGEGLKNILLGYAVIPILIGSKKKLLVVYPDGDMYIHSREGVHTSSSGLRVDEATILQDNYTLQH